MNSIFLSVVLSLMSFSAFSQVQCSIGSVVRCPCPASMSVTCPNGVSGWVDNQTPAKAVTLKYTNAQGAEVTVTLENPEGSARDLYAPNYSEWVKSKLPQGASNIRSQSFVFDNAVGLYEEPGSVGQPLGRASKTVSGNPPTNAAGQEEPACLYLSNSQDLKNYLSVKGEQCSRAPMKVCFAEVRCSREFKVSGQTHGAGSYNVYCKADQSSQRCPSDPLDCMMDPSIDDLEKEGNEFIEVQGSGRSRAISQ